MATSDRLLVEPLSPPSKAPAARVEYPESTLSVLPMALVPSSRTPASLFQ